MGALAQRGKKPKRMTLAEDVSRSRQKPVQSPFGAMNRREVPPDLQRRQEVRRVQPETATTPTSEPKRKGKKDDDRPLFHALKMQQALAPISYSQRDRIKLKLEGINSFEELGLTKPVVEALYSKALPGLTDYMPTPVQKLAVPALLAPKRPKSKKSEYKYDQFLIAAETGSGKTLAYALPLIDAVKRQEQIDLEEEEAAKAESGTAKPAGKEMRSNDLDPNDFEDVPNPKAGKPRALILLPSSELVRQVGSLIKVMSHDIKYRSAPISSSNTATVILKRLFNPSGIDIVVATPHLISSIAKKEPNILSRLQYLVVDEADSLLDRSFAEITCGIIDRAAPSLKQLTFCSATIPRSMDKFLDKRYPEIVRIVTPKLHSITRRVNLGVIEIDKEPYRGNRSLACADILWKIGKAEHDDTSKYHTVKSIMVFVNEREAAEELAKFLASKGIDAAALTRDTQETRQGEILEAFTSAEPVQGEEKPDGGKTRGFRDFVPFDGASASTGGVGSRRLANTKVLVTTDLGSRGIDTLSVRHVILYDVPHTTIDFVHRLGRVGRMGRRGRAVVLVGNKDRKDIVREVRDAMFRGQALI
jgi:ATP-dependent RNA helicase MRH4, mitochondrial